MPFPCFCYILFRVLTGGNLWSGVFLVDGLEQENAANVLREKPNGFLFFSESDTIHNFPMQNGGLQQGWIFPLFPVELQIGAHLGIESGFQLVIDKLVFSKGVQSQMEI